MLRRRVVIAGVIASLAIVLGWRSCATRSMRSDRGVDRESVSSASRLSESDTVAISSVNEEDARAGRDTGAEAPPSLSSLTGRVTDAGDRGIGNASVLVDGVGVDRAVATDREGRFRFDELPPGTYHLSVKSYGFDRSETMEVELDDSTPSIVVELSGASMFEATALLPGDVPAAGATVTSRGAAPEHHWVDWADEDGRFRVPIPDRDGFTITIEAGYYVRIPDLDSAVVLREGRYRTRQAFAPGAALPDAFVLDAQGVLRVVAEEWAREELGPEIRIRVERPDGGTVAGLAERWSDGVAQFDAFGPGTSVPGVYHVVLHCSPFAPLRASVVIELNTVTEVRYPGSAERLAPIQIDVHTEDGKPVASAILSELRDEGHSSSVIGVTDGDGRLEVSWPFVAESALRVEDPARGRVRIVPGVVERIENSRLSVVIERGVSVRVQVRERGGEFVRGARVELRAWDAVEKGPWGDTSEDGEFVIDDVAPAKYVVMVSRRGQLAARVVVDVDSTPERRVEIEIPRARSVHGFVTRNGVRVTGGSVEFDGASSLPVELEVSLDGEFVGEIDDDVSYAVEYRYRGTTVSLGEVDASASFDELHFSYSAYTVTVHEVFPAG
ncbi:MAG: carboxypeptidase regulatory-like domain-containing protein, partial [Planctomycetes bacterium]|nr:carboxypeptidase regulatory-like domain-containing protein [Planctomycetota bacterium]